MTYREQLIILLQRCGLRRLETREKLADLVSNSDIKPKDCIVLHAPEDAEGDFYLMRSVEIEVIGNTFDNPGLLESKR